MGNVVAYSETYPAPTVPTVASGSLRNADENRLKNITGGAFTQALLGYKDQCFVTVGARVDGNSAFGEDFGFQTVPQGECVMGGIRRRLLAREVRHPQGARRLRRGRPCPDRLCGRADVEPGGLGTAPAVRPLNLGDPNLGPERTVKTELGFDQTLFNGRFSVDFTWDKAVTDDALLFVRNVPSNGFLASSPATPARSKRAASKPPSAPRCSKRRTSVSRPDAT